MLRTSTPERRRKIRVLFCIPNFAGGGAEKIAIEVSSRLDRSKFDVTLFAHERLGNFSDLHHNKIRTVYASESPYSRWRLPKILLRTASLTMRADIVIGANEGRATGISLICAIILRRKFISWIHCDWGEFRKYVSWRTLCALQISRWSDKIVVVSIGAMDSFMRIVAVSKDKVTCIPNAIDVAEVLARANESMQEEDRHIFRDPTIVSVGRLNTQKNHQFLIRSHAMLRQRGIWQRLVIVGQGDLKDSLMTLARELSVADTVHLIGFRSNPYPYIAAGTVFAFTSLFEGMGIVLIEATVIGTGVVSINCPSGPSEVLAGGQLGVLVPPNDLALFSDEIARFIVNPAHKENFRRADVNNSIRFDIPQLISSWERVLEQVYAL